MTPPPPLPTLLPEAEQRDPTPLYHRIYQTLRKRIMGGDYHAESQLPTENALMREFGASRHTVRTALQLLVAQRLLHRQAGRGTFVRAVGEDRIWVSQSLDDVLEDSFGDEIVAPKLDFPAAGSAAAEDARRNLRTEGGAARVTWRRRNGAGPCSLATIYLPEALGRVLPEDWAAQLPRRRLLHMVEELGGVEAQRVRQIASAVNACPADARLLDVPPGTALLVLHRSYVDATDRVIQYSRILGRPNRGQSAIELTRARR